MLNKQDGWCQNVHEWHREALGKRVVASLKKNLFDAVYFKTSQEAADFVLSFCQPGKSVAFGGSMTLMNDMDMVERVRASGATLIENVYGDPAVMAEGRRKQLLSDVFLCSSNAITADGWLVNIDGAGNRTGAMTFGPRKVIVVAGINKISPNLDAAWERLENVTCPKNMKRLGMTTPCATTGYCLDCSSDDRGCRIYTIVKRRPMLTDVTVVIVGEELGY